MAGDRFRIGEKVYTTETLDEISLRDLMLFNRQAADMGLGATWADVERISAEIAALDENSVGTHPDMMLMVGVTVWASRRQAGDDVTFEQAVDVPLSKIVWLESPKDRQPKTPKKRASGKGSALVAAPEPEGDETTTHPTSEAQSESA